MTTMSGYFFCASLMASRYDDAPCRLIEFRSSLFLTTLRRRRNPVFHGKPVVVVDDHHGKPALPGHLHEGLHVVFPVAVRGPQIDKAQHRRGRAEHRRQRPAMPPSSGRGNDDDRKEMQNTVFFADPSGAPRKWILPLLG